MEELAVVVLVVGLVGVQLLSNSNQSHGSINGNEDVDASGDGDGKIVILALFNGVPVLMTLIIHSFLVLLLTGREMMELFVLFMINMTLKH